MIRCNTTPGAPNVQHLNPPKKCCKLEMKLEMEMKIEMKLTLLIRYIVVIYDSFNQIMLLFIIKVMVEFRFQ